MTTPTTYASEREAILAAVKSMSDGGNAAAEVITNIIFDHLSRVAPRDVSTPLDTSPVVSNEAAIHATQTPEPVKPADAPKPFYPHTWERDGDRCTVCGDKDWMGGSCRAPATEPAKPADVGGLLPCPFCGSKPVRGEVFAWCDTPECPGQSAMATPGKWNTRAPSEPRAVSVYNESPEIDRLRLDLVAVTQELEDTSRERDDLRAKLAAAEANLEAAIDERDKIHDQGAECSEAIMDIANILGLPTGGDKPDKVIEATEKLVAERDALKPRPSAVEVSRAMLHRFLVAYCETARMVHPFPINHTEAVSEGLHAALKAQGEGR